mgnify:CR=1 FL=1
MPKGVFERKLKPILDRTMEKISPEPNSGCWLWEGSTNNKGYGLIGEGRRKTDGSPTPTILVHRVTYENFRGPIPGGLELDHKCRVSCCANPWHLELVTHKENCRRGNSPWAVTIRTGKCKRGHVFNDETVYVVNGKRLCKECCKMRSRRTK